jgi:hypothetical protein
MLRATAGVLAAGGDERFRPGRSGERGLRFSWILIALVGGFIAAAIGEGFGLSSWPARAAIFLGFAVVTYFSILVEMPAGPSKWWHM